MSPFIITSTEAVRQAFRQWYDLSQMQDPALIPASEGLDPDSDFADVATDVFLNLLYRNENAELPRN